MKIEYIAHKGPDGVYWAEVPAIPGCVSDGRTLAELAANIREAVEGALESYAMLPPGADPSAAPCQMEPGGMVRSFSLRFERPSHRKIAALA